LDDILTSYFLCCTVIRDNKHEMSVVEACRKLGKLPI
jgi:hypothetical protein